MDVKVLVTQYQNGCARLGDLEMQLQILEDVHQGKRQELLTQIEDTRKVLRSLRVTLELQNAVSRVQSPAAPAAPAAPPSAPGPDGKVDPV